MTRWTIFALCLLVLLASLSWATDRMLRMERQGLAAMAEAEFQERVRLALWRLDAATNPILIRENARPPHHYRAFHSADEIFSSSYSPLEPGATLSPSPLLMERPQHIRLHFEQAAVGQALTSPQVPGGELRALALEHYLQPEELNNATRELRALGPAASDLHRAASVACTPSEPHTETGRSKGASAKKAAPPPLEPAPAIPLPRQTAAQPSSTPGKTPDLGVATQAEKTLREARVRSSFNFLSNDQVANRFLKKKESVIATAAPASARMRARAGGLAHAEAEGFELAAGSIASADEMIADSRYQPQEKIETTRIESFPEVTAFSPVWNDGELFLLRQIISGDSVGTQGIWLAWPSLKQALEDGIRDLLPAATLLPDEDGGESTNPLRLMTLPIRLSPGPPDAVTDSLGLLGSPLRRSLGLAWVSVLAAAGAVAALLYGAIRLGERRGAFVSAVTHELRTPLTTFQLYTDLLAEGGVEDPDKRRSYVDTLRGEAGRLSHLVENVLAYAQLERSAARRQSERISLAALLERARDRLEHRASGAGMALVIEDDAPAAPREVEIDVSAVEQILFNLVDNACKYARRQEESENTNRGEIHLSVGEDARGRPFLRVADNGPGIRREEARRLFRPFEKSADQAAHSAPGVGLGLALCRRLARALGGDLVLEKTDRGASFLLILPE
jgi:signal transduction histidine kinase